MSALDPHDVISENLVTFRDIVELQSRNTQLLRVVRQLSKQREEDLVGRQAEVESAAAAGLQVCACGLRVSCMWACHVSCCLCRVWCFPRLHPRR